MSSILTEKIPATRVTFVVDDYTLKFLSRAHLQTEPDEIWIWESSEDIEYEYPGESLDNHIQLVLDFD